jgi:hypothetical protein
MIKLIIRNVDDSIVPAIVIDNLTTSPEKRGAMIVANRKSDKLERNSDNRSS